MKISQSLLKSLLDYRNGKECGHVFKAKYLDNRYDLFPPSDAQNLGTWFEYKLTGAIPKNGVVPNPEYMKRGKDENGNPQLTADYRLMSEHIENFNKIIETYEIDILSAGEDIKVYYPNSLEKFGEEVYLTGTLDIRARAKKDIFSKYENHTVIVAQKGQEILVDIKSSGLLSDKWNDYGWELENLHNKVKLVTQPIHYKYIEYLKTGDDVPFLFFLFHSKNSNDARVIDFRINDTAFSEHELFIEAGIQNMIHYKKNGFKANPTLERCGDCPLRDNCPDKAVVAPITIYYFANQP